MKNNYFFLFLLALLIVASCSEDEQSCSTNAQVANQCYEAGLEEYNVQFVNSNTKYFRENLFIGFSELNRNGFQLIIDIRSDTDGRNPMDDERVLLKEGATYFDTSLITYGNTQTGSIEVVLTKVDRESGLVSGRFLWERPESDLFAAESYSGTFADVSVNLVSN